MFTLAKNKDTIKELILYLKNKFALKVIKVVCFNNRKERYTFLATDKNKNNFIIKWNLDSSSIYAVKLNKEILFYSKIKSVEFLPTMIKNEENLLILEKINGLTFRDWLIKYLDSENKSLPELNKYIKKYFDLATIIYQRLPKQKINISFIKFREEVKKYLYKILYSGPQKSSRSSLELIIAKITTKLFWPFINRLIKKLPTSTILPKESQIHGDFHLNNILIDSNSDKFKVIDWEDSRNSLFILDFCYGAVMISWLLKNNCAETDIFKKEINDFWGKIDHQNYLIGKNIYALFYAAIQTNRRFGFKTEFGEWVKNIFKFHAYLVNNKI